MDELMIGCPTPTKCGELQAKKVKRLTAALLNETAVHAARIRALFNAERERDTARADLAAMTAERDAVLQQLDAAEISFCCVEDRLEEARAALVVSRRWSARWRGAARAYRLQAREAQEYAQRLLSAYRAVTRDYNHGLVDLYPSDTPPQGETSIVSVAELVRMWREEKAERDVAVARAEEMNNLLRRLARWHERGLRGEQGEDLSAIIAAVQAALSGEGE